MEKLLFFRNWSLTWDTYGMVFRQIEFIWRSFEFLITTWLVLHTKLLSLGAPTYCGWFWDAEPDILCWGTPYVEWPCPVCGAPYPVCGAPYPVCGGPYILWDPGAWPLNEHTKVSVIEALAEDVDKRSSVCMRCRSSFSSPTHFRESGKIDLVS